MDEQALDRLFSLAKGDGYTKSFEEFKVLMNSNEEAISIMFSLAKGDGYKKDVEEFKTLVGFNAAPVKKKDSSEVISEDQPLVSEQEVGTSDVSGVTDQKGIVKPGAPYQGSPEDIESNPMYSDEYKAKFKTEEPIAISSDITTTMSSPLTEIGKAPSKLDKVREEVSLDIYGEELITTGKNTYDFLNTTPESEGILEGTGLPSPNSVNLLLNKEPEKNKDNSYNIDINISKLDIAKEALEARGRTLDDKNADKFFKEYYRAITGNDSTMPRTTDLGRLSAKSLKDDPEDSKLRASLRESYPTQYSLGIAAANLVTGGGITKGETAQSKENNAYVEAIISTRKKLAELYKEETAKAGRQIIEAETISKSGTLSEARETLQATRAEMDSKLIRPEELKASKFLEFAYNKQQLALEEKDPIKKAEYEAESKKWFSRADEDRNNIILNLKINAKKIELKRAQEEGATPGKIRQLDKELNELMTSVSADDIYNVRGNETLYNPITGEFISNSKPNSTIRYINDEIDTRLVKYLDTPVGQLKEQVDDLYYRALSDVKTALFGDRQTLISDSKKQGDRLLLKKNSDGELEEYNPRALLEQYDKASNKSLVELLGMGNKKFVGSLGGDDVIKASGLKEEDLENYFNYVAITRTIALNEDPGSKNLLELKTPYNFFGEALVEGVVGSQETELDQSRRSVEALAQGGLNLSEDQKEIAAVDLTEQISRGAGSLAPVMIEIGADMFILNKAGGLLKIPKAIEKIAGGSKALKKALDFGYTAAKQGQAFEMAGQGFEAGVGEQLGEGATQLLLDKLGSKNIISKVLLRVIGGAVGETSGEYMGEVFDRYIAKDEELMDAISNTIGSPETAKEKATVTFLLSLLMSGTMAPFSISQEVKQDRIDYLKSDRGRSEMIDKVLKIAEEGGDGSEYFEPLREEAEKRIRERATTESKESGQDIEPDLSSESIMGEITAMIEADGQTGVNINEYRRTSKDEKNPEVKKLKEQIEGLRDEDGLIPQDKKTELDRLNKAIAEVEAQPTSEVEVLKSEKATKLAILDSKVAESKKTGAIPVDENGNALMVKEEKAKIEAEYDAKIKEVEAQPTSEVEAKEAEIEEWENAVPFKIAKQKAKPDSEQKNDFDAFNIFTNISEKQFNAAKEAGQPIKLIDSNKNEFIPETYEEYANYIEFEKKMLSAKIEQAIRAKDEQKGIENLVMSLSQDYGYDMVDVAQIKRFIEARRSGKTNASTAEWLLGPLAKTQTSEVEAEADIEKRKQEELDEKAINELNDSLEDGFTIKYKKKSIKGAAFNSIDIFKDGEKVGNIKLKKDANNNVAVSFMFINEDSRRKGIAKSFYKELNKALIKNKKGVLHSDTTFLGEGQLKDILNDEYKDDIKIYKLDGKEITLDEYLALGDRADFIELIESNRIEVEVEEVDAYNNKSAEKLWIKLVEQGVAEKIPNSEGYRFISAQQTSEVESKKAEIEEKSFNDYDEAISYRDSMVPETKVEQNKTVSGQTLSAPKSTTQKRGESLAAEFKEIEASKKDTSKIEEQVENAKKAIAKVSPKTKIVVHKTAKDYKNSGKNRKQNEGGEYDIEKDTIHINLESANERTIAHEVFHALLLNKGMNDKQAKSVTDNMLKAVKKTASPELLARLEEFSGRYESALQSEESIAELFGILAAGYPTLPRPTQNIIKRWLDKLAKLFGLKMFTDNEVVDMLNVVSKKVKEGVEISEKELKPIRKKVDLEKEFEGGIPVDELTDADMNQDQTSQWGGDTSPSRRMQSDFSDPVSKLSFRYDKNNSEFNKLLKEGYITKDKSISDFDGKFLFFHQPDAAFSGSIYKDGELLVEGKGGMYYPIKFHKDGYFWASTSSVAEKMARDLNKVMDQNDGTIYMALTTAPRAKLLSSTTMSNAVMEFFSSKAFDQNFKISEAQLKRSLIKAAKDTKTINGKKVGLNLKLSRESSIPEIKKSIAEKLSATNSTFNDRKNFSLEIIKGMSSEINKSETSISQFGKLFSEGVQNKYFKGITKTGKLKISAANMTQALSEMLTEPLLKDGVSRESGGQIYAVIELEGAVKATDSNKHESYPKAIQADSKNKVKLHVLTDRVSWSDVAEDFDTNDIVEKNRKLNIFPTSGVSTRGLKVNTKNIASESRSRKQLPADTQRSRKQIVGENAELSDNVRDNLSVAREMGTANKDTKTIRTATGWEKGADGKFRYEIDDVLIKDDFSYKDLKRIPSGLYSGKLSDVINNEKLFDSYSTRFTQEVDILNDDGSVEDFKRNDNYPPISDIKVYFREARVGTALGEYDPFFKTITINIQPGNSTNKQISTVLLHEIQHYIQGREGFARGGDPGMFDNEMDTLSFGNVNALRSFAKDVAIKNPEKGWDITYGSDAVKKYEEIFGEKPSPTVVTLASVLEQQLSRGIDVDETTVYKTLKNNNLTSFEKYERLAGEVESRNVEKRKDMTPEQRRETTLQETEDVAREDQIFFTEEPTTRSRKQLPADDLTKIEAVRKLAQEKGYTEAELKVALETLGFSRAEINSTKEKSITDAQEKFDTSIKRGNTKADAVKSALGDLESTTWYSITTDTKREEAVIELKESLGEKIKNAPSVKKILGVKKKKVTVDEMAALKSQIKLEAKAARESVKAYKDASKKIITYIKQLQKTGVITNAQSSSMIKKVLSTNMLNDKMVSRLEAYISKIYTKAELAEKISRARKLRKTAIKNIKSKVGPSRDLLQTLRDLFSVDPSLIPLNKIDAYLDILTQFGERSAVLKLKEAGEVMDSASDILSSIEEVDKVDLDKLSLPNKLNEEIEADLDGYLKGIISNKIEFENVQEGDAKDLAMFLNSLTSSDLELLIKEKKDGTKDYSMLEKLREVKSNITNGYVPALANSIRNTVKAKRSESKIRGVVEKTKKYNILTGFSRVYGKVKGAITGKTGLTEAIRGTMTTAIDDILGNFNSKTIYNNVILPLAQAFSAYQADMSKNVDAKLDLADSLLYKTKIPSIQRLTNAVQKSKYKIQAYRLQREFESNPDSKQVATAVDFIDATIEAISFNEAGRRLNQRDIKILKEIKKEFSEGGQISLSKIEDSLSKNEKKALKLIDEAADMEAKALWTATVIRGVGMKPINNYVHHNIIPKNDTAESDNVLKGSNKMSKPSTNAGTLRERTPGAKAINFDPISSTSSGARETLLDYHMTDAVKVVNAAVKGVKYTGDLTKGQQDAINAIDNIKNELLDNVFKAQFVSETSFGGVLKGIQKLGYAAALASVPRAGAELGSNLTYAFTQPQAFLGGVKNFGGLVLGAEGMNAMDNLGSTETMRLYDTDVMTSKMVDSNILHTSAPKAKKTAHSIVDKASFIYQMGPKQLKALTTFVADKLISTPDKAISRPFWFGAFALSFKKSTGISLTKKDMQEVADGTSKYLSEEYKDAREKATKYADQEVIKMASSNNPFNTVLKNVVSPNDAGYTKIYKAANSYMSTFMMNEYATARNAVLSLFKQGDLSKAQSVATLSGLIIRMGSYMVLYSVLRSAFDSLFGYEDEDEEELSELALRQFIGAPITLITGRGLGQVPRLLVNFGVEQVNENYLEGLRDGKDYDPYKHSLVFSQVSEDNLKNKTPEENLIKIFAGPYSPLLSSASRFVKVVTRSITSRTEETKDKYKKELEERMTIEAMGNLGFLPFYKDIRRIILKDLFKEYNEPKKKKKKKKYNWRISG